MLLFIPLVAALVSRKYWGVCYFFVAGCSLVACYLAVLLASIACKLILSPPDPSQAHAATTGLVFLLIGMPAPGLLARALTLKYWQPWTTPDMWEAGDERAPAWAAAATGIGNLPQADETRPPAQPERRKRRLDRS